MSTRARVLVAVLGAVVLAVVAVVYVTSVRGREAAAVSDSVVLSPGELLVRSTADSSYGHVVAVSPSGARAVSPLSCTRVYAAARTGLCLRPESGLTTYQLVVLDSRLGVQREIPLVGLPNRARVSTSGRMLAWTVFVTGDSYNGGMFSTRAGILDTSSGTLEGTLEDFAITVDGSPYHAADVNFWGVTFASDDRTFYATMSTAGRRYLVVGDFVSRTVRTLRTNVECPSLSPDGTRLAYKSAIDGDPGRGWRLSTLDLASGVVTPLAETRSVDDQAAWIDAHTVAYALPKSPGHSDVGRVMPTV